MTPLAGHIRSLIEKNGPISLARYMELALQHPEHGYYRKGDPLGRGGDFITAPEISQMFGELIGLAIADTWKQNGRPEKFVLLELGPGRGTLLSDALRATSKIPGFHAAMDLRLMESNETLRTMQQEKLAAYKPHYIDRIDDLPPLPTFILANEFFDALPVRQFVKTPEGWRERLVMLDGDEFALTLSPPDPSFFMFIPSDMREAKDGAVHEVSLPSLTIIREIAQHIVKNGGAALIVDYGYAAPPYEATIQALAGHRRADILERPGEIDITAHVDFTALRMIVEAQGARVFGPVGQGEYLQTLGIDMRAMQLKHNAAPEAAADIDTALHRLTSPSEMGALFKVMAVVKPDTGFAGF